MGIGLKHTILLLLLVSSAAIYLAHAQSCGGPCVVVGGSSSNFMGDPVVNLDMSSPDEFIRESLGSGQTSLSVKTLSLKIASNNSSSLNQTNNGNVSQNSTAVGQPISSPANMTSDNTTVKLGAMPAQNR